MILQYGLSSSASLEKLSDQEIVCFVLMTLEWGNNYLANNEAKIIERFKANGVKVNQLTPEQKAVFKENQQEYTEEYRQIVGDSVIDLFTKDYKK